LKVFAATCLFPPPISLYNSLYQSEYDRRVSSLLIFIDSKASIGWGARLQVTKHAPNAWTNSLKLWLNHLIVVGSRLDGNTLHISPSYHK